jgi:hypothetical protein
LDPRTAARDVRQWLRRQPASDARTFWPAERARVRFRYPPDISHIARWCRLEDPVIGQVAFVEFR